jgi:dipeptidyl aminopeptidase/acylaminoacyl peptidase
VVAPSQSENMARALREAGKNVTLVKLEGDDHWLSHGATRVRMLQELEKFLAAQLHP